MRLQAAGRPSRWTDVCEDLCPRDKRETLTAFTKHLYKKFHGLLDALRDYGTKESSGSWKQDGAELGRMVSIPFWMMFQNIVNVCGV